VTVQNTLDQAAAMWRADDTEAALKMLEVALVADPGNPLLRIQKYYMEKAVEYRKGHRLIQFRVRESDYPEVTVIMATYDRNTWIRESIESVLSQQFTDWELVLVNDGGSPEAGDIAANYYNRRIVYVWAEHGGLSSALNVGLRHSRGKYIALLDDDDIYYPDHLGNLVEAIESNPSAPLVYSEAIMATQKLEGDGSYRIYKKEQAKTFDFDRRILGKHTLFATCNALVRRECFERQGGFNESLLCGMDWEMWLRISRDGDFVKAPKSSCEFRRREDASNMTTNRAFRRAHFHSAIATMHGTAIFDGKSFPGRRGAIMVRELSRLLEGNPDFIDELDTRKLLETRKPYQYFEALSKRLAQEGEKEMAGAALKAAIRAAPYELKLWIRRFRDA